MANTDRKLPGSAQKHTHAHPHTPHRAPRVAGATPTPDGPSHRHTPIFWCVDTPAAHPTRAPPNTPRRRLLFITRPDTPRADTPRAAGVTPLASALSEHPAARPGTATLSLVSHRPPAALCRGGEQREESTGGRGAPLSAPGLGPGAWGRPVSAGCPAQSGQGRAQREARAPRTAGERARGKCECECECQCGPSAHAHAPARFPCPSTPLPRQALEPRGGRRWVWCTAVHRALWCGARPSARTGARGGPRRVCGCALVCPAACGSDAAGQGREGACLFFCLIRAAALLRLCYCGTALGPVGLLGLLGGPLCPAAFVLRVYWACTGVYWACTAYVHAQLSIGWQRTIGCQRYALP